MQRSDPPLDAVHVAVVVVAAIGGGEIAPYVGPYLVILAAAVVGAVFSLMRREPMSRWQALGWVLWLSILSLLLTGAIAAGIEIALLKVGWEVPSRYLLALISMAIAAVGLDWPKVALWAAGLFHRRSGSKLGGE